MLQALTGLSRTNLLSQLPKRTTVVSSMRFAQAVITKQPIVIRANNTSGIST